MTKNTKILIGVVLLILGAVVIYFMMNKKGTTTTSTTTSTGLHGLDLGGIFSALAGTGTKEPEQPLSEDDFGADWRTGAKNNLDVVNNM